MKKNWIKIVNFLYLAYIIIYTSIMVVIELKLEPERPENILVYIWGILVFFIFAILKHYYLSIFVIAVNVANYKFNKEIFSKLDFEKSKTYFRDILKDYSIVTLSYIDDYELSFPKDLITIILSLINKKIIEIKNGKIVVINNLENMPEVNIFEKYILDHIENGYVVNVSESDLKRMAQDASLEHELLEYRKSSKFNKLKFILIFCFPFIAVGLLIVAGLLMDTNLIDYLVPIIVLLILGFGIYRIYSFFYHIAYGVNRIKMPYLRTKKGNEINEKLEGLKAFLKDFSVLETKESEEIMLWEEYLIYSVLFEQNEKIILEYSKLIK